MLDDFQPRRRPAPSQVHIPNIATLRSETVIDAPIPLPKVPGSTLHPLDRLKELFHKPRTKKQWALLIAVLLIVVGGSAAAFLVFRNNAKPAPAVVKEEPVPPPEPPKPVTEPSRLTGVQVAPELNQRPVTGVMIENSPDARPQAGLNQAGVIYEAIAEGGITRFLALFQEGQPDYIGPVRSARPYFIDFIAPYDAGYAHVGGSPEALAIIRNEGIRDLDQFHNSGAYQRAPNRYAPHNMYTSMAKLDAVNQQRGYTGSNFAGLPRKPEAPNPAPSARAIDLAISSFLYNVHYDYDAASNSYKRSMAGKPHVDEKSNTQLSPKVVVALVMNKGIHPDRVHTVYGTTGSGKMFVFQDGVATEGTWTKAGRKSPLVLTDAAGQPMAFNPGQTWITIVHAPGAVSAKP